MKLLSLMLFVMLAGAFCSPAFAQDIPAKNEAEKRFALEDVNEILSVAVNQVQRCWHIARRESLRITSQRNLRFRCGRYWVDVYGKLIAPNDREVGIWGVDVPAVQMPR